MALDPLPRDSQFVSLPLLHSCAHVRTDPFRSFRGSYGARLWEEERGPGSDFVIAEERIPLL